jgi:hypothetical protein
MRISEVRVVHFVKLPVFKFSVRVVMNASIFWAKSMFGSFLLPFVLSGLHALFLLFVIMYAYWF